MSTPDKQLHSISPFELDSKCDEGACAHDRIFEAAKKLFYKSGIRGVSVEAIAAEANTTKVTLYRVYSSKDELIVKVLEEQAERWKQWWDEVVSRHPGEPRKQIETLKQNEKRLAKLIDGLTKLVAKPPPRRTTAKPGAAPTPALRNDREPDASFSGEFAALRGKLRLPVRGEVANRFGAARAEGTHWKGLFVRAQEGAEVKSVATVRARAAIKLLANADRKLIRLMISR